MTARFHRSGGDFDARMPTSQWQREISRGSILPMGTPIPGEPRTGWRARLRNVIGRR